MKIQLPDSNPIETKDLEILDDQAMYKFNHATSCWCVLKPYSDGKPAKYFIVPSTYKRVSKKDLVQGSGPFHLSVIGCKFDETKKKPTKLSTWNLIGADDIKLHDEAIVDKQDGEIPPPPSTSAKLQSQLKKTRN